MTIYKYPLEVTDMQTVKMPAGAEILTVQVQHGTPCVWAKVDPNAPPIGRVLQTFGTGHEFPDIPRQYVGTYQLQGGALVFHVFEV